MRPRDELRASLARLAAEIDDDLAVARRRRDELAALLASPSAFRADAPTLAVAALAVHHLYSSLESALRRAMVTYEGSVPQGADWHRELLHLAGLALPEIRPALLARATCDALAEPLRFRHFLRHAYAADLDAARMLRTSRDTVEAFAMAERDLGRFVEHLRVTIEALGEG